MATAAACAQVVMESSLARLLLLLEKLDPKKSAGLIGLN
jgi:hypothetical protein